MLLPVPQQPDCATAWLNAVKAVDARHGHEAYNVVIDILDPTGGAMLNHPIVARVNDFLLQREKSVDTIANTIIPYALYQRHGHPKFIEVFHDKVLPKVRKGERWSRYYFERMTRLPLVAGGTMDQLSELIDRIKSSKSLHNHQVSLFDPERDSTDSVYGGQCLSFLSFHLLPGNPKTLLLTAQYRNHYYIEKLLGNLMGLGRLMAYIAAESGTKVGSLTVISTHATIDLPHATREDIKALLSACAQPLPAAKTAA